MKSKHAEDVGANVCTEVPVYVREGLTWPFEARTDGRNVTVLALGCIPATKYPIIKNTRQAGRNHAEGKPLQEENSPNGRSQQTDEEEER